MKKKIIIVIAVILVLLAGGIIAITNGLSDGKNVVLDGISLSGVADGSYVGTYERGRWTNTVSVRVESGEIAEINVVSDVFGADITDCMEPLSFLIRSYISNCDYSFLFLHLQPANAFSDITVPFIAAHSEHTNVSCA